MSIYNAIANMGKDAGAGLNAYASAKYQHKQDKRRNALIDEDRAIREEDRQYGRERNALADKRYEDERRQAIQQEAQQHASSTQQAVMQAKTPEQAQAIWEQGQQQAIDLGYLDPNNAQPWDQVGSKLFAEQSPAGFTLSEGQRRFDAQGNLVAEVAPQDPVEEARRLAEMEQEMAAQAPQIPQPPPTPMETAKLRKAEADAAAAEASLQTTQRETEAKNQTAQQVRDLASELLQDDNLDSVFGNMQGMMLSLFQSTVDAESKVDQLVDMLTLENIDKMSGVLSDTDIKILKNAGSRLSNKRISDKAARSELEKIAGVIQRNPKVIMGSDEVAAGGTLQRDETGNVVGNTPTNIDDLVKMYGNP